METSEAPVNPAPRDASAATAWRFVPSLYFLQGLPVVVVQQMSTTMYKKMGVPNDQIGLWTSLIAFPWIAKMLWGPLVDSQGTKRSWIVVTQAILIAGLGFAALGMSQSAFLAITLGVFFLVAVVSATHDIAADGFYLLALPERLQAGFVGLRSAFFRLAMIFATGGLVVIAGRLEAEGHPIARTWVIALAVATGVYALFSVYHWWALPKPASDVSMGTVEPLRLLFNVGQVLLMILSLMLLGRLVVMGAALLNGLLQSPIFTTIDNLTPLFLPTAAGQGAEVKPYPFLSPDLVVPMPLQFGISLGVLALAFVSTRGLFRKIGMAPAAREYFGQNRIVAILGFILFYRFGESMISKMSSPFLLDPPEKGGLGVTTEQVGVITGTVGIIALTIGGLLGGLIISKWGIKRSLWPMVLSLNLPNLFYVWAAYAKPGAGAVTGLIAVDQFGYGFGFSAYMVYLMFLSQNAQRPTSHYAISTGLMALGAMFAGILSGYLQTAFAGGPNAGNPMAYAHFFIAVCLCTIPGMLMLFVIPMDREDLKVAPVDID